MILALELYLRIKPNTPSPKLPEVVSLSREFRHMAHRSGVRPPRNYRTAASVVMKLMNFRSLDDDYPGAGLTAAGHGDRKVWDDLCGQPVKLRSLARGVRAAFHDKSPLPTQETEGEEGEAEGGILFRLHRQRERSAKLTAQKKQQALELYGCLTCEICGFDFSKTYSNHGQGYIECHHIEPLASLRPNTKTRLKDLALVCANCHRMLHRLPWPSISELKGYLVSKLTGR